MHSKSLAFCFAAAVLLVVVGVSAQADYHHVHLTANDPEDGAKWYAEHFDGTIPDGPRIDRAVFGDIGFLFFKKSGDIPGSVGSAVDHIGFSVEDIDAKMAELEAAGVKIISGVRELPGLKIAFVEDPWGTKIEVVQDLDLLGFHHIHLHSPDVEETIKWYQDTFGGEPFDSFKNLPLKGLHYGDVILIVQRSADEKAPTKGRSIDHLGFGTDDLDADFEKLTAKGVTFSMKPVAFGSVRISFIDGPDGVRIEYVGPGKK